MKIIHRPDIDFLSIDFKDEVEKKSIYKNGIILRLDSKGNVIGIDFTDSSKMFSKKNKLNFKEACKFLDISESTLRRMIRDKKIPFKKIGGRYYFLLKDLEVVMG